MRAILIGAGNRGRFTYGAFARSRPERLRIVGLAEPHAERRATLAAELGLAGEALCEDWRELLDGPRRAEIAIVATGDTLHVEPALRALERGHHVLLEKPIAMDPVDCQRVVEAAERAGRLLQVAHVLRHTAFYERVYELVASGRLGRVVAIDMKEHVATWHMTHSYVRGKFRSRALAAPILLAKTCHDLDLLVWFAGAPARRVASFGARSGYAPENAPPGAPERCTDGCPVQAECPHDAVHFYLGPDESLARIWPWTDVSLDPSREARRRALETGPYGRCVYQSDNDVLDHQVVAVEFEGGATGTLTVQGHASRESRTLRISGTEGELRGVLHDGVLEITRHGALSKDTERFEGNAIGHFGGDFALVDHFAECVAQGEGTAVRTSGRVSLESHLLGFAAERAREEGRVVDVERYRAEIARAAGPG